MKGERLNPERFGQIMEFLGPEGVAQSAVMSMEIQKKQIAKLEPLILECLSFFECKKCGECCRDCPVQLIDEELMVLLKRDGDKVFDLLDEDVITGNALKAPCSYLKNNACEINDIKPFVCRVYPFTLKYMHFLAVCLCPMGKEIADELQKFVDEHNQRTNTRAPSNDGQEFKQAVESGTELSNYLFDAVGYKRGRVLDQAYLPYAAIPLFLKYLKSKKK